MLNIVYMGTPDFSVAPLKKLLENGDRFCVKAVITNVDKPVGRKQVLTPCPVKSFATEKGLTVFSYNKIRLEGVEDLKRLNPDVIVTCAFGQILSREIIDIPKYGVINVHASLLPKYRGASPIHYAILNGETETGVTIMKTDEGIDTGDVLISEKVEILKTETMGDLFNKLSPIGADLLIKALDLIVSGNAKFIKQDDTEATYSKIIKKEMALIDWSKSSKEIVNQIRAFNPSPVAYTFLNGLLLKIYTAKEVKGTGKVGQVLDSKTTLVVGTGDGAVEIEKLQKAGGNVLSAQDFLRGNKIELGTILG